MQSGRRLRRRLWSGSRRHEVSVNGGADMSVVLMAEESGGGLRVWMWIWRPDSWSLLMELWNTAASFGMERITEAAPWEAKSLERSIIGIKCPPPTNGKKKMWTCCRDWEAMEDE